MRFLMSTLAASLALAFVNAGTATASDVELKGPHICCSQCVTAVKKILEKVEGVTNATADAKAKTVTFTAANEAAAKNGIQALVDGGFYGAATEDGKAIKFGVVNPKKGEKADKVTVKNVHACCAQCHNAIKALYKGSNVTFEGKGAQRTVIIEGSNLELSAVIESLRQKGFNGSIK